MSWAVRNHNNHGRHIAKDRTNPHARRQTRAASPLEPPAPRIVQDRRTDDHHSGGADLQACAQADGARGAARRCAAARSAPLSRRAAQRSAQAVRP